MVFSLPLFVHVWYFACNEVHVLSHWYGRRRISVVCVLLFCSFQRSLNVNLFKTNNSNDTTANVLDCNRLECSIKKKLRIWSHLLKKSLMENFIFCAVIKVESGKHNEGMFTECKDCDALRNLEPLVQFKNVKNTHGRTTLLKVTVPNRAPHHEKLWSLIHFILLFRCFGTSQYYTRT